MILSYDEIYDHKFPVTKCTISADRKTRKITALAQIPLGSSRLDMFDFVERVKTSASSCAVPTWRTTNKLKCSPVQV